MISGEEFKNLVLSSIQYSGNGMPYLIVNDDTLICPFCSKQLKIENSFIRCNCEESLLFIEKFIKYNIALEQVNNEIKLLKESIKPKSLKFFKEFFQKELLHKIQEEYNRNIKEILELEL